MSTHTVTITAAQAKALGLIAQRGYMTGGTGGQGGVRLATVRKLAELGLITLRTQTHNAWFGGQRTTNHAPVTEWTARLVGVGHPCGCMVEDTDEGERVVTHSTDCPDHPDFELIVK